MKKWFYYFRDANNNPVITVCLTKNISGEVSRGIAICSDKDNFRKKDTMTSSGGRSIAYKRAIKALIVKETSLPIKSKRALSIINKSNFDIVDGNGNQFLYKSVYHTVLTKFEKKLDSHFTNNNPIPTKKVESDSIDVSGTIKIYNSCKDLIRLDETLFIDTNYIEFKNSGNRNIISFKTESQKYVILKENI